MEQCPVCTQIKEYLLSENKQYTEVQMDSVDGQVELKFNGVFTINAPVLQVDNKFYHDKTFVEYKKVLDGQ